MAIVSKRFLALTSLVVCAASVAPASADLQVPLEGGAVAQAVARRAAKKQAAAKPVRQDLASRSMPVQIGIRRRGGPPVLPPADGRATSGIADSVSPLPAPEPGPAVAVNARLGKLVGGADVFRMPDPRSQWVARFKQGQQVAIVSQWQGWFAIVMGDGSQAYVPQTHVEVLPFQVRTVTPTAPAPPSAPTPAQSPLQSAGYSPTSPLARAVIQEAFRYQEQETRYVWGGNDLGGIDCSGLVRNCFAAQGVKLPRRASEQIEIGEPVSLDQLQPGDRLYFSVKKANDHTGIYIGDGQFIHASRSRGKVGVDNLSQRLYRDSLTGARRL